MSNAEDQYKEELAANGVQLPEVQAPEATPESKEPEPAPAAAPEGEAPKGDTPEGEGDAPLQPGTDDQKPPKRSIYDEYKDKKDEAKALREIAVDALRQRGIEVTGKETLDELKGKLSATPAPEPQAPSADPIEAFTAKYGGDPEALRELQALIQTGSKTAETDPELLNRLKRFEDWQATNAPLIEKQQFDAEFGKTLPTLKELFPNAVEEDLDAMKAELEKLGHTAEYHQTTLDVIAFKERGKLGALITPRKKGMESKERKQDAPAPAPDFNPEADLTKMTPAEFEAWEKQYKSLTSNDGLLTDAQGRKTIV